MTEDSGWASAWARSSVFKVGSGRRRRFRSNFSQAGSAVLTTCLLLLCAGSAKQDVLARQTTEEATLQGWTEDMMRSIGVRNDAYGGIYYDRGLFRPWTPDMDSEYHLDERTAGFTMLDDARFYDARYAFRSYAGSINTSEFITFGQFRAAVPVTDTGALLLEGIQRHDLRGDISYLNLGYRVRVGGGHRLAITVAGMTYKPDVDAGLRYEYQLRSGGRIRVDWQRLDIANNLIFNSLGVDEVLEDTVRSYTNSPNLFVVHGESPTLGPLRMEFSAGYQTRGKAQVSRQSAPDSVFIWEDGAAFAGILAEYRVTERVSAGVTYQFTYNDIRRGSPASSLYSSDYTSTQQHDRLAAYVVGQFHRWTADAWLARSWRTDQQEGLDYDQAAIPEGMDYRGTTTAVQVRVRSVPDRRGMRMGMEFRHRHLSENEDGALLNGYRRFEPRETEQRLTGLIGYQFRPDAWIEFGASYDLDGDGKSQRFDGGFMRMTVTW